MSLHIQAQSLSGLRLGDDASRLATLGSPVATDKYKAYVVRKWSLANGNELSVTTDNADGIVYMESDWGRGSSESTGCDVQDLKFGVTTLSAVRKRFGSNGFAFKKTGGVLTVPDGVVMINSFEFGHSVVTFFTAVRDKDGLAEGNLLVADRAKLDAISIATEEYAKSEWGERTYDSQYRKAEWK